MCVDLRSSGGYLRIQRIDFRACRLGHPHLKLNLWISLLQISLKLHLLPKNVFDNYLHIAWKHIS